MNLKEIEKIASLSKIRITEDEKKKFIEEIEDILTYVKDVEKVSGTEVKKEVGKLYNVMREDGNPHEPKMFTEQILANAPDVKDGFFKVKKVLGND